MIGYCVRCARKHEMVGVTHGKTKTGQPIAKGKCKVCGTKVNVFQKR